MLWRRLILISLIFCFFCGGALFYLLEEEWSDFSALFNHEFGKPSIVLDDQGEELARFELDRRVFICFDKLPKVLINAFLSAEDHQFFEHSGISFKGIIRSSLVNLCKGKKLQGASTITQQVVRMFFLSTERTFTRKIREIFLAIQLESQLTKHQIFELYINNIYFGRGIYGVEAACMRFWNKSVVGVSADEAATLAAIAKSAKLYSPLNEPENSKKRRNIVLNSMQNLGFISKKEFEKFRKKDLDLQDNIPGNPIRLYIQEWIRVWAEKQWGRDALYTKGLKIQTTINLKNQQAAEKSFKPIIDCWRGQLGPSLNGGMISVDSHSGAIRALIGGIDFNKSQVNRAFQSVRQMGSSFKPIVFTAALQNGLTMNKTFIDEPIDLEMYNGQIWSPRNWNRKFEGKMTLQRALTISNNIVAVKTLFNIGYQPVIDLAKKFGINRQLLPYPSLALGITEATTEENVAAFNVFANNGVYVKPYLIEWVKDELGNKIWQNVSGKKRIIDHKINSKMVHALALRMKLMKQLRGESGWFDSESIGKTGSTNDSTTNWFVGATPGLTTAVYVGRDDGVGMGKDVFGNQTSFPIWLNYYKGLTFKEKNFYIYPSLKEVFFNWFNGEILNNIDNPDVVTLLE